MGRWTTLHLFDDNRFYKQVVPELRGEIGNLESTYAEFLKQGYGYHNLKSKDVYAYIKDSLKLLHFECNKLDTEFKQHKEFDLEKDMSKLFATNWYLDLCHFFEYYVFYTCADFYPHLPTGRYGLNNKIKTPIRAISSEIFGKLDNYGFFCYDLMGIDNWITSEEVELLYYDKHRISALHDDYDEYLDTFLSLVEVAYHNKLGLLLGGDMREETLKTLPQFKLLSQEKWHNLGLCKSDNHLLFSD